MRYPQRARPAIPREARVSLLLEEVTLDDRVNHRPDRVPFVCPLGNNLLHRVTIGKFDLGAGGIGQEL